MITRYAAAALERAEHRLVDDNAFAATVRGLRRVVATGPTLEAGRRALAGIVEEWIQVRVAPGLPVPHLGKVVTVRRAS
jgi:hypothetical protein